MYNTVQRSENKRKAEEDGELAIKSDHFSNHKSTKRGRVGRRMEVVSEENSWRLRGREGELEVWKADIFTPEKSSEVEVHCLRDC